MTLRFPADVTECMVMSLNQRSGRAGEFGFEQAVLEAPARPAGVQVQDTAGSMDVGLRREGRAGDKDLGIQGLGEETVKRERGSRERAKTEKRKWPRMKPQESPNSSGMDKRGRVCQGDSAPEAQGLSAASKVSSQ